MTRDQALYFLEGMTAGLAAPNKAAPQRLFEILSARYEITQIDLETIRWEVDAYLDAAESGEDEH